MSRFPLHFPLAFALCTMMLARSIPAQVNTPDNSPRYSRLPHFKTVLSKRTGRLTEATTLDSLWNSWSEQKRFILLETSQIIQSTRHHPENCLFHYLRTVLHYSAMGPEAQQELARYDLVTRKAFYTLKAPMFETYLKNLYKFLAEGLVSDRKSLPITHNTQTYSLSTLEASGVSLNPEDTADDESFERLLAESQNSLSIVAARYGVLAIGPAVTLLNSTVSIGEGPDQLLIKGLRGYYFPALGVVLADRGGCDWPTRSEKLGTPVIEFHDLLINRQRVVSKNARLLSPQFPAVKGSFTLDMKPAIDGLDARFTSQEGGYDLLFFEGEVSYRGGFALEGPTIFGVNPAGEPGTLSYHGSPAFRLAFEGKYFDLSADVVGSQEASMTMIFGSDTLYHPGLEFRFDRLQGSLVANVSSSKSLPFVSSYHEMLLHSQRMIWSVGSDSLVFDTTQGRQMVPFTLESRDYFTKERFSRMGSLFRYHPITVLARCAAKAGSNKFYLSDAARYLDLPVLELEAGVVFLADNGFLNFDRDTERITLLPRLFHYYKASAGIRDYDNIFISSVSEGGKNAVLDLSSKELRLEGVEHFFLSPDYRVKGEPADQRLLVLRNRNIKFSGNLVTDNFEYQGDDFLFDYDRHTVDLSDIESIEINTIPHSEALRGEQDYVPLNTNIRDSSGTFFVGTPGDRSQRTPASLKGMRRFESSKPASVYLGTGVGAIDTDIEFVIPELALTSGRLTASDSLELFGKFHSGGMFDVFEDTLQIMENHSLGFLHEIPEEGYNLYGQQGKVYDSLHVSSEGVTGKGRIELLNATMFSDNFGFFSDRVESEGYFAKIEGGKNQGISFPQMTVQNYLLDWKPEQDILKLESTDQPFMLYEKEARLRGALKITPEKVLGEGELTLGGSTSLSPEYHFEQQGFEARRATLEITHPGHQEALISADSLSISYDNERQRMEILSDDTKLFSLRFPFSKSEVLIPRASWHKRDSLIVISRMDMDDALYSTFISHLPELKEMRVDFKEAVYELHTQNLMLAGVPFLEIADAQIIPKDGKVHVLSNSAVDALLDARILIRRGKVVHHLANAYIGIVSDRSFLGSATYLLPIMSDTVRIVMDDVRVERLKKKELQQLESPEGGNRTTVAIGNIDEDHGLLIAPGFLYKGAITLRGTKQALELSGFVQPDVNIKNRQDYWVPYTRESESLNDTRVTLDMEKTILENGDPAICGIFFDQVGNTLRFHFFETGNSLSRPFFESPGTLSFDEQSQEFLITQPPQPGKEPPISPFLAYNDRRGDLRFQGKINFLDPSITSIRIESACTGTGKGTAEEFKVEALMVLRLDVSRSLMSEMASEIEGIMRRRDFMEGNSLDAESLTRLSLFAGQDAVKGYVRGNQGKYMPLMNADARLRGGLVISRITLQWNTRHRAWYSNSRIHLSSIGGQDINAVVDGFVEIRYDREIGEIVTLFVQVTSGIWYYFQYRESSFFLTSANKLFNDRVIDKSFSSGGISTTTTEKSEDYEVLKFVNTFRKDFLGINTDYDLNVADEPMLEDERFDTIEEDDGDGFDL